MHRAWVPSSGAQTTTASSRTRECARCSACLMALSFPSPRSSHGRFIRSTACAAGICSRAQSSRHERGRCVKRFAYLAPAGRCDGSRSGERLSSSTTPHPGHAGSRRVGARCECQASPTTSPISSAAKRVSPCSIKWHSSTRACRQPTTSCGSPGPSSVRICACRRCACSVWTRPTIRSVCCTSGTARDPRTGRRLSASRTS